MVFGRGPVKAHPSITRLVREGVERIEGSVPLRLALPERITSVMFLRSKREGERVPEKSLL